MRAAVLTSIGDKLQIRDDVSVIGPSSGEVHIKIRAAGVCHTDLSTCTGALPSPMPVIPGHEAAGDVISVGEGVIDLAPGDRVIGNWLPACRACPDCLRGEPYLCLVHVATAMVMPRFTTGDGPAFGLAGCGGFAEEMVVPRAGAVKIDDDVPYEVAALVGCGVMTGVGAVLNTARVEPGARVAVIGCGGVGIAAVQAARISGASVIVAVDTATAKHEVAQRFGATHACGPDQLSELAGEGFDYVFEVVGLPETIRAAWSATRRGGTVVVVSAGRGDHKVEFNPFELFFDAKTLRGSMYGSADPQRDYYRILDFWRSGQLDLAGMISHRLTLEDADDALAALHDSSRGDVIRQVIVYD